MWPGKVTLTPSACRRSLKLAIDFGRSTVGVACDRASCSDAALSTLEPASPPPCERDLRGDGTSIHGLVPKRSGGSVISASSVLKPAAGMAGMMLP